MNKLLTTQGVWFLPMKNLFPKNHDFCLIPTGKGSMKRDYGNEKDF